MFFSPVGSGSRRKFSAVCGVGICHGRDGRGGTATKWWPATGRGKYQGILLCSWCSWKKHVGCSHCCSNHGNVAHWRASHLVLLGLLLRWCSFLSFAPFFKAVNRGKGLLPDPTVMQILTGLNNPAALKMLINPMVQGNKQGKKSLWRSAYGFYYGAFWWLLCVQASSVQPLPSHCWPTLPFLLPCSRFFFRTRPKSNRYCSDITISPLSTSSFAFHSLSLILPIFFLSFSVDF